MSEATTKPGLLTVSEASERMRLSKSTLYREIDAGELRAYRLGRNKGAVRIPEDAIDEYLGARLIHATTDPGAALMPTAA